mmetsp:Transcript_123143/g.383383  ORF Transcript_123143/g.383383 Transcript_123143/m.383383 type:complete len:407 (-) Transcript_123143:23-1243(-)
MGSPVLGWSCAVTAAFTFSVQYVPVKQYEVYDGITFQWFLCHGVLFTAFVITMITGDIYLPLDNLPIIAGLMWGLSNYLCVPLIQLLGMGIGFSLYHFMNIMCGYSIGRFGLFGIPQSGGPVSDVGFGIVFLSFVLMTFVETGHAEEAGPPPLTEPIHPDIDQEYREQYQQWRLGGARGSRDQKANFYMGAFGVLEPAAGSHADLLRVEELARDTGLRCRSDPGPLSARDLGGTVAAAELPLGSAECRRLAMKAFGVLLAIVCGVLTGTCAAPATLYNLKHPGRPTAAVFPMCLGVWVMSTFIYLAYAGCARFQRLPVRHAAIRPAFLSGALWSIGNACNLLGVTQISYTLCYSTGIIGCLLLAGIYSLLIFREIKQARQILIFCLGLACQSVGVVLIAVASGGSA